MTTPKPEAATPEEIGAKLSAREMQFLRCVYDQKPLALADRVEDRARQKVRRLGLAEVLRGPRRWSLTSLGRTILEQEQSK